jgi:hypothetical protein
MSMAFPGTDLTVFNESVYDKRLIILAGTPPQIRIAFTGKKRIILD